MGSRSHPFLSPQLPEPAGQDHSPQLPPQRAGCVAIPSEDHRDHRDQVLCQRPEFQVGGNLPHLHDHSSMIPPSPDGGEGFWDDTDTRGSTNALPQTVIPIPLRMWHWTITWGV